MPTVAPRRPRILLLSMYPLDRGLWGPTVRITHMRDALSRLVDLDVVSGLRRHRALALMRYAAGTRLGALDGIYVESSTTLPGPLDVAFLAFARRRGVPVLTYVRDAYPLFPEYAGGSFKERLRRRLFMPAFRGLAKASTMVAYPSRGLADVLSLGTRSILLPPGAPDPVPLERRRDANQLLHVGSLRHAVLGAGILREAVESVRAAGHDVELTCVAQLGDDPPGHVPAWMHVVRASGSQIHDLLPAVLASVIPRHRSPYNDLALPIKVMDYLSYGRPLLVTNCTETARIVRAGACGVVVDDTAAALAAGITELVTASALTLDRFSEAAHRTAEANAWRHRAQQVVDALSSVRARPQML